MKNVIRFAGSFICLGALCLAPAAPAQESIGMKSPLQQPVGSGTSWLPASSPVHDYAYHLMTGNWMLMAHGEVYARYVQENANNPDKWPPSASATGNRSLYPDRERGDDKFDFPNWAMVSADRPVFGEERILLRAMMSLDPLTEGRDGYPLLFQAGEGLVDRQHAHDLFMELAALYKHHFSPRNHAYLYFGLPGEPALGPTAFMHRPSAWNNPEAPLAHHTEDATHITYGVATLGWIIENLKAEASTFRGKEPDDERWDIEAPEFDSYSLRLAYNLGTEFSLQGSGGFLNDTEPEEPGVDVVRVTASLDHNRRLGPDSHWASSIIYGSNTYVHGPLEGITSSGTLETSWAARRTMIWGRWESVERLSEELDLPGSDNRFFWVHRLTAGTGYSLVRALGAELFLGGQGSLSIEDAELNPYYGNWPLSWAVFLKLRPVAKGIEQDDNMQHDSMHPHGHRM
jgi:hypothetical protein